VRVDPSLNIRYLSSRKSNHLIRFIITIICIEIMKITPRCSNNNHIFPNHKHNTYLLLLLPISLTYSCSPSYFFLVPENSVKRHLEGPVEMYTYDIMNVCLSSTDHLFNDYPNTELSETIEYLLT